MSYTVSITKEPKNSGGIFLEAYNMQTTTGVFPVYLLTEEIQLLR